MRLFWYEHAAWSRQTFGGDDARGPIGPLKHLQKEVAEALENPEALFEYADCVFLIFDAARRAGMSYYSLERLLWDKLAINRRRTWPKPTSGDAPVEHER